jgi:hypothetical protein
MKTLRRRVRELEETLNKRLESLEARAKKAEDETKRFKQTFGLIKRGEPIPIDSTWRGY